MTDSHSHPDLHDRTPYVGTGIDGALRSAEIDRAEADTLDPAHDAARIVDLRESAVRWERQAERVAAAQLIASLNTPDRPVYIGAVLVAEQAAALHLSYAPTERAGRALCGARLRLVASHPMPWDDALLTSRVCPSCRTIAQPHGQPAGPPAV